MSMMSSFIVFVLIATGFESNAFANSQFDRGVNAVRSMAGCYLVDYSYAEIASLKDGYVRDTRVYDVNRDKSVKEWIYVEDITPSRMRLQHILFATDLQGNFWEGSELRHQAEDWEFNAHFLYDFTKPNHWSVVDLSSRTDTWTRRITNLDDGLRYQCASQWLETTKYPEWTCTNYAPIPGRETRDMGRKDYNTLDRTTRILAYGSNWLERQDNTKTIDVDGVRTPLAKETGKNWYVRLPDSECAPVQKFVSDRQAFWTLLRQTWDEVFAERTEFIERELQGKPKRYSKMMELEAEFASKLGDPSAKATARERMLELIRAYRQ